MQVSAGPADPQTLLAQSSYPYRPSGLKLLNTNMDLLYHRNPTLSLTLDTTMPQKSLLIPIAVPATVWIFAAALTLSSELFNFSDAVSLSPCVQVGSLLCTAKWLIKPFGGKNDPGRVRSLVRVGS